MRLLRVAVLSAALLAVPSAASAAPYCRTGISPSYAAGFAHLREVLGEPLMGQPVTCEFGIPTGDTAQITSGGFAYYRKATNTPIFFDGSRHYALTTEGIALWDSDAVDVPTDAYLLPYDWECSIGIPIGGQTYYRCP